MLHSGPLNRYFYAISFITFYIVLLSFSLSDPSYQSQPTCPVTLHKWSYDLPTTNFNTGCVIFLCNVSAILGLLEVTWQPFGGTVPSSLPFLSTLLSFLSSQQSGLIPRYSWSHSSHESTSPVLKRNQTTYIS